VNRVLLQVNERICEMTGYTREELVGRSARMLYPTQEEFEYVGREKYAQIDRAGIGSVETRWQRKDGQIIDILLSSVPLDPSDLAAGVTFTALDITERKRAAEEHRQMQAQVQHVQKLESLGILAGGIAHDFNNLLMAVLGNADLAMRSLSRVSPAQSHLREIESASRRAAELCRQLLAYSGKGRFVVEPLDLNEVVREMTRMLEVSISKSAVLKYNLAHNLPAVESDVTQVRQVLMNLITNASEAIGDRSGIISISTGARRCDRACLAGAYIAESLTEGPFVYVEVADTGCGMTPEVKSRIFDPFFTTKFTGRGLGMAAVLGIVRGHGARSGSTACRARHDDHGPVPRLGKDRGAEHGRARDERGVEGQRHDPGRGRRRDRTPGHGSDAGHDGLRRDPRRGRPRCHRDVPPTTLRDRLRAAGSHHAPHGRRRGLPRAAAHRRERADRHEQRVQPAGGDPALRRRGAGGVHPEALPVRCAARDAALGPRGLRPPRGLEHLRAPSPTGVPPARPSSPPRGRPRGGRAP
jgi:PAS domain S-box-containing protein